jgi:hypothetical protein
MLDICSIVQKCHIPEADRLGTPYLRCPLSQRIWISLKHWKNLTSDWSHALGAVDIAEMLSSTQTSFPILIVFLIPTHQYQSASQSPLACHPSRPSMDSATVKITFARPFPSKSNMRNHPGSYSVVRHRLWSCHQNFLNPLGIAPPNQSSSSFFSISLPNVRAFGTYTLSPLFSRHPKISCLKSNLALAYINQPDSLFIILYPHRPIYLTCSIHLFIINILPHLILISRRPLFHCPYEASKRSHLG